MQLPTASNLIFIYLCLHLPKQTMLSWPLTRQHHSIAFEITALLWSHCQWGKINKLESGTSSESSSLLELDLVKILVNWSRGNVGVLGFVATRAWGVVLVQWKLGQVASHGLWEHKELSDWLDHSFMLCILTWFHSNMENVNRPNLGELRKNKVGERKKILTFRTSLLYVKQN